MISVLKTFLRYWLRATLTIFGLFKFKHFLIPNEYTLNILRNTSIFINFNEINVRFLNRWHEANVLFEIGNFYKSVAMHRELLTDLRHLMQMDSLPSTYSYQFGSNIGHVAVLYMHQSAQNLSILPKRRMLLPRCGSDLQLTWLKFLKGDVTLSLTTNNSSFTELPTNWPFVENLRLFSVDDDYIDQYSFFEKYFKVRQFNSLDSFEFPVGYFETAQEQLKRLGIRPGNPFVSLHVRNGNGVGVRRAQNPANYVKSIRELISLGYQVIRIGDKDMDAIPELQHLIDLRDARHHWLHPFVLGEAKLHIGTMSGPSIMSMALQTPTLVTNATSLARNTLTGNSHTFFLPKHLFIKGRELNLRESLQNTEGYSEIDGRDLQKRSILYVENSEEEILRATCEVIQYLETNSFGTEFKNLNTKIDSIRKEANALSYGKFAVSFCMLNPNFFE